MVALSGPIGPGNHVLVGMANTTTPIWLPFFSAAKGATVTKSEEQSLHMIKQYHKNMYEYLHPDALQVKIKDFSWRLTVGANPVIIIQRGQLYVLSGELQKAEEDFLSALSHTNNEEPTAHYYMGVIANARGKRTTAIKYYTLAIQNFDKRRDLGGGAKVVDDVANTFESVRRTTKKTMNGWRVGLTNVLQVNVCQYETILTYVGLFRIK